MLATRHLVQRSLTRLVGFVLAAALLLAGPSPTHAGVPESAYAALRWRLVGPLRGGWATVVAGVPGDPATWYFGAADGGVWRTRDAGITWRPLFDREGSASIGALAIAPSDPQTLWVGTGQIQQRWDIVDGDGVYRSTDGGTSWVHAGLAATRHIGRIWVDPRDANVAVVAALGHVFGPHEERGLFRTEDGGRSWRKVLYHDERTGGADIASDPARPDVLYASLWEVERYPWLDYFQPPVGPGSGIYKSDDGGRSWSAVGGQGLPAPPLGRIALAVAPGPSSRRVWAAIDTPHAGGLYRSDDGGSHWRRMNEDGSLASSYMSNLRPDPRDPETVWAVGRSLRRSTDAGQTFHFVRGSPGGDDYHDLWIDPGEPRRMITGADQGAVVTLNGGETWSSWYNQPTGEFYRLAIDDRFPYWIYSGQQDSGTVAIASRSDYGQITFRDWHPVGADERDGDVPDPARAGIVYGAGLGGRLSRWNAETGQVQNVSPWPVGSYAARPGTTRYRYSWITPLAVSLRPPHAIYQGAQVLFRSTDSGHSWQTISPDLTGAVAGAPGCDGDVPASRATACGYGVVFTIAPSPAADGLVWVGTDNGRVQLTRDDGQTWTDVTPSGLEDWSKVNIIDAAPDDPATAYVAADRHRLDDFRPIAYRTHDYGRSWTEIGHGLPDGAWVGVVRVDPKRKGLLFAGTSRGVHVSFDDGDHWQPLQLNLPRTGVNDLLVHGDDVVVATQGRAIWALDAIEPLRHLTEAALASGPLLLPPPAAWRLRSNENKDTPLPLEEPRGENPPLGALIDYVLPNEPLAPLVLEIAGKDGEVVARFASDETPRRSRAEQYFADAWLPALEPLPARAGHNRFVWDLRRPAPRALEPSYSIGATPFDGTQGLPAGAYVLPGEYEVRLRFDGQTVHQPLQVVMDPRVDVPPATLEALATVQREVEAELARSAELGEARNTTRAAWARALRDPSARNLRGRLEKAQKDLGQLAQADEEDPERVNAALTSLATDLEGVDAAPTEPQLQVLALYREGLGRYEARWRRFASGTKDLDTRVAALSARLPQAVTPRQPTPLFNGSDLTGWTADVPSHDADPGLPASFVVRSGLLVSLGEPRGHLVTDACYRDYRLEVEYRFPGKGGNCGVLVHASRPRALYGMFPQSIEVQMQSGDAGDFWCIQENIEVPDMEARRPRKADQKWGGAEGDARRILNLTDGSEKPLGEWNTMVVEARGRTLKVWVNGELVNAGGRATADRGRIALQAEGTEVEFRRVEIGPLPLSDVR